MPVTNVPTPGSPIRSNWATSVSNVANAAETMNARLSADTGVVALATISAFTGNVNVRRVGAVVTIDLDLSKVNTGSAQAFPNILAAVMPAEYRPVGSNIWMICRVTSPADNPTLSVNTDGTLEFPAVTANAGSVIRGALTYCRSLP